MFCRLKDFRRIATRYYKPADSFLSALQADIGSAMSDAGGIVEVDWDGRDSRL